MKVIKEYSSAEFELSLVARGHAVDHKAGVKLLQMCKRSPAQERAPDANPSARLSLACPWLGPISREGSALSDGQGLFLPLPKLSLSTSTSNIAALKAMFSRYGIPETL